MWLWNNLLTSIICVSSVLECGPKSERQADDLVWNPEKIETVAQIDNFLEITNLPNIQKWTKKQIFICMDTDSEGLFTHKKALEQVSDPKNTILEYPAAQLFQKYWTRPHPLRVSWVGRGFEALLWKNWIERLLSRTPQKLASRSWEVTSSTKYEVEDTLRFSIIDPLLKDDFPQYLSDQLKEEWFEHFSDSDASTIDKIISNKNNPRNSEEKTDFIYDIVVKRAPSWKSALALYRNWELFMATYVSVWINNRKTKTWQFKILSKEPYKRSHKYDNAAMPEALSIGDGFYFHQWRVTWGNLSHWCVRMPWVYADILYSSVKDRIENTDVFISKNLYK